MVKQISFHLNIEFENILKMVHKKVSCAYYFSNFKSLFIKKIRQLYIIYHHLINICYYLYFNILPYDILILFSRRNLFYHLHLSYSYIQMAKKHCIFLSIRITKDVYQTRIKQIILTILHSFPLSISQYPSCLL